MPIRARSTLFRERGAWSCALTALLASCAARVAPEPALPAPEYTQPPEPAPIPIIVEQEPLPAPPVPQASGAPVPAELDAAIAEAARAELAEIGAGAEPGANIHVAVERGVAMLSGRVPSLLQARAAVERVETVRGVRAIIDRLEVAPVAVGDPELELEQRVRSRLGENPALAGSDISVSSRRGAVQLRGVVGSHTEKELALRLTESVPGVRAVDVELEVEPRPRADAEIESDVLGRLAYDAYLSDDPIQASVEHGLVSLSGVVGTLMEKRRARTQAWVSGVRGVDVEALAVAPARRDRQQRVTRPMPTDEQVSAALRNALSLDPRVPEGAVEVRVEAGIVRLAGTVASLVSKQAAERDATNTLGVWRVENLISVSPDLRPSDAALEQRISERLAQHPELNARELSIEANAGRVLLRGAVDGSFQSALILGVVESTPGVVAVDNELRSTPPVALGDDSVLEGRIEQALWWDPRVDSSQIQVEVRAGVAIISGRVPSRAIHQAVLENVEQARPLGIEDRLERAAR